MMSTEITVGKRLAEKPNNDIIRVSKKPLVDEVVCSSWVLTMNIVGNNLWVLGNPNKI